MVAACVSFGPKQHWECEISAYFHLRVRLVIAARSLNHMSLILQSGGAEAIGGGLG